MDWSIIVIVVIVAFIGFSLWKAKSVTPSSQPQTTVPDGTVYAKRKRRTEAMGSGCLLQLLGLLAPFLLFAVGGIVGAVVGVILVIPFLLIGSVMATKWICGNCGNRIDGKQVMLCPTCKASFAAPPHS